MIELAVTLLIGAAGVLLYVLMDSRYERRSDIGRLTDSHQGAAATGSRPSSSPSNEEPRATAAQEAPHMPSNPSNPTTKGGPRRSASRDLVRLTCPSCDDEIRVPADEVRPKCERCSVLLLDVERPVCPRPHEFAVTELIVRQRDEERHLYPIPGGYEVS